MRQIHFNTAACKQAPDCLRDHKKDQGRGGEYHLGVACLATRRANIDGKQPTCLTPAEAVTVSYRS
jgi:hypothetical protein